VGAQHREREREKEIERALSTSDDKYCGNRQFLILNIVIKEKTLA
jgi:hypothetical protein